MFDFQLLGKLFWLFSIPFQSSFLLVATKSHGIKFCFDCKFSSFLLQIDYYFQTRRIEVLLIFAKKTLSIKCRKTQELENVIIKTDFCFYKASLGIQLVQSDISRLQPNSKRLFRKNFGLTISFSTSFSILANSLVITNSITTMTFVLLRKKNVVIEKCSFRD